MPAQEEVCVRCNHIYYDHAGWKEIAKYKITHTGCRIIGCGCDRFESYYDRCWEE